MGSVGLGGAHDRPPVNLIGLKVSDLGLAGEGERVPLGLGCYDHRAAQPLAQALDFRLEVRLVLLGGVILSVLLKITVSPGDEDALRDLAASDGLKLAELALEGSKAFFGDRLSAAVL
jgi:hypothetical protein